MDRTELISKLDFIADSQSEIQIIVYALVGESSTLKRLDIKEDDLSNLKNMFCKSVKEKLINKNDYSVLPISSADERKDCFYEYDLVLPEELSILNDIIGDDTITNFDFRNEDVKDIQSLIVVLSDGNNHLSLYKNISPVEIIGRGSYLMKKANQRFERFQDNLLRISPNFHFLSINEKIIILDLKLLERFFGFVDVIEREANLGVDAIRDMNIVSNVDSLRDLISDVAFARKLTKIAGKSPVILKAIPNEKIILFTQQHPALKGKLKYTNDNLHITLSTKRSKDLFVKLLNDDFLTSELTDSYYESLAKDGVEIIEITTSTEQ